METYKSIQQAIFNNWFDGNCTTDIIHEWNVLFLSTIVNKLSFVVPNGEINKILKQQLFWEKSIQQRSLKMLYFAVPV